MEEKKITRKTKRILDQIKFYNSVLEKSRINAAWVYKNRGDANYELEEYDKAIEDYKEAIKLDSQWKRLYKKISKYYMEKGNIEKSNELFI